ncbi:MAG: endonuclease [Elusimicrobia bacterium]|nr:endonuclease [Elusimicrobiota bacterium]
MKALKVLKPVLASLVALLLCVSATTALADNSTATQSPSAFDALKNNASADISKKLSGEKLFQYLHKITKPSNIVTDLSEYTAAKSYMYSVADNVTCNGRPGLITFYSLVCANGASGNGSDYNELGDANGDGTWNDEINTEHIWPQSFFSEKYPMRADLHHLRPTFIKTNTMRANHPFAVLSDWDYSTSAGTKQGDNKFEPCDSAKGDVARAMFYFMVRYYDRSIRDSMDYNDFWINRVDMLLEWNRQDPPDDNEKRRNNLIEKYQGNRNPFTDEPSLADKIGAQVFQSH